MASFALKAHFDRCQATLLVTIELNLALHEELLLQFWSHFRDALDVVVERRDVKIHQQATEMESLFRSIQKCQQSSEVLCFAFLNQACART
jgi:hypothetical protein